MKFEFSTVVDKVNCHVRSFGSSVVPKEKVNQRPHKHYFMEFHYVFEGEEELLLPKEDRRILLIPGKILMLPRDIYHGATTKNSTVERICFNFSVDAPEKENSPILELYQTIDQAAVFEDPQIDMFMHRCRQLRDREGGFMTDAQQGLLLLSVVLRLFERVSELQARPAPESTHALRQKWIIEEYIEQHFTDNMGLEGLAQALYLSQRQTRKLVQRFMGEDFKSIIIRRRMELAEIYLRDPEKALEEIAWQVGYRSYSGFQLCFKKYFGVTPSAYREKL